MGASRDRLALLCFLGIVVLGGVNGTSIKVANQELDPFWSAALRFGLASLIFISLVLVRHVPLPRGRALAGSLLYGFLSFGVTFALVSWGLVEAPAGAAQIVLALVPLLTLLLAVAAGLESYRLQSVAGSLIAVGGIGVVFAERIGLSLPVVPMLAILGAAFSIAAANIVVKRFPRSDPTANNAIAMGVGALMLFGLSLVSGESMVVPQAPATLASLAYLVVIGSVVVFTLYLYVIVRWTASATSYTLLLMPLVSIVVANIQLGEPITVAVVGGGALVIVGVYLGAFAPSIKRPLPGLVRRVPRVGGARRGPPALETPNCP